MVLLSNNSIWDISCFLRANVLLSKEQSDTVDKIWQISINWRVILLSILIIRRGQQRLTPLGWFTTWWRHSIWSRATKRGTIKSRTSHRGKARFCIMRWLLFCRTKPKGGMCLLVKWADTDFWLYGIVMCSTGYVNCDKIHFRIVHLTLLNCRFKNSLS